MKEQRSDYNALPKDHDTVSDTVITELLDSEITQAISSCGHNFDLLTLFEVIFKKLHPLFSIDCGALILYDKQLSKIVKSYTSVHSPMDGHASTEFRNDPVSLSKVTKEIVEFGFPVLKSRENWVAAYGENHYPHSSGQDYLFHCYIPLEINNVVLGTLELHNQHKELSAEGLTFCCNIADLLAELIVSPKKQPVDASIADQKATSDDYNHFISFSTALAAVRSEKEIIKVLRDFIGQSFKFSYLEILQEYPGHDKYHTLSSVFREIKDDPEMKTSYVVDHDRLTKQHKDNGIAVLAVNSMEELGWNTDYIKMMKSCGMHSLIVSPLRTGDQFFGFILIGLNVLHQLTVAERLLLEGISSQLSIALCNLLAYENIQQQLEEINAYRTQLEAQTLYKPEEEVQHSHTYDDIVGSSKEMKQVFNLLTHVSGAETTVLILGETGTGKELIAKAIHNDSDRKSNQMIKVNCAAIPPNLIESELFGHEKGSFTGATERRTGKFELANNSTLFLDEIGELSLDLQVKLLRVLQEKEIERVGGKTVISVDVRIVSATNRNLQEEVEAGRFRSDLFYRLNVFPISLPPLRKRKEDIPLLAGHFLSRFANKSGKKIDGFSQKVLGEMMRYSWPGNIRELEHLIERQVLLTKGPIIKELEIPEENKTIALEGEEFAPVKTILENERDHIFAVLKICNGKISGKDGAAKLLAVPATTLNSKIKRLGLAKKHIV